MAQYPPHFLCSPASSCRRVLHTIIYTPEPAWPGSVTTLNIPWPPPKPRDVGNGGLRYPQEEGPRKQALVSLSVGSGPWSRESQCLRNKNSLTEGHRFQLATSPLAHRVLAPWGRAYPDEGQSSCFPGRGQVGGLYCHQHTVLVPTSWTSVLQKSRYIYAKHLL